MTTIARVAQEAGVGVGTVSRVINGSSSVSEATRRRVLEVVAELGYEPNATARALSTGRTGAVAVVAPFFTEPSVVERLRAVSRELADTGYQLILFGVESPEQRDAAFGSLVGRVDGVLAISLTPTGDELERLEAAGVPVVLVDHAHARVPTVTTDDVEGGRIAAAHLLELGHERIAFLGDFEESPYGFTSSARRRLGYEGALSAAGLEVHDALIRHGPHGRAAAAAIAEELLGLPEPPTAVFTASDAQALGVLEAAATLGVEVPGELSVVGFDDVEIARYAGLTTVAQPLAESGARGVGLLLAALGGAAAWDLPSQQLPLELVVRETTAEPGSPPGRSIAMTWSGRREATGKLA